MDSLQVPVRGAWQTMLNHYRHNSNLGGAWSLVQGTQTSRKGQRVDILGFMGYTVSVTTTNSAVVVQKQATDHM